MNIMKPKLPPNVEWKLIALLFVIVALVISKESDANLLMALF